MSEFGGLWKHENNQHVLVVFCTPEDRMWLRPIDGGIKNGTHTLPLLWRNAENRKKKTNVITVDHQNTDRVTLTVTVTLTR